MWYSIPVVDDAYPYPYLTRARKFLRQITLGRVTPTIPHLAKAIRYRYDGYTRGSGLTRLVRRVKNIFILVSCDDRWKWCKPMLSSFLQLHKVLDVVFCFSYFLFWCFFLLFSWILVVWLRICNTKTRLTLCKNCV